MMPASLIGKQTFEAKPYFYPDLPITWRDQQYDFVVDVRSANAPPIAELPRKLFNRLTFQDRTGITTN